MRISIVLGPFQPMPPHGYGAVEKVWTELAREFAVRGHRTCLLGRAPVVDGPVLIDGVEVRALRGFDATGHLAFDLAKDFLYALAVARRLPPSDIIVTNTFWAPVVLTLPRRSTARVIVHVARFPKRQMRLYSRAAALQAISSAVAQAIVGQAPALAGKVSVIGYPVDVERFAPTQSRESSCAILYVGRVHPEKGVHLLVDAFRRVASRVPKARLDVVGPADERRGGGGQRYLRSLEGAARGLDVRFAGPVADESALAALYRSADCFCYPSVAERGEAFGRAVLEAMASGTTCVVSALECFRDFVRPGENALVFDHRDANATTKLAEALIAVLGDRAGAARLARAGRLTAERHSLPRIAGEYLRLFESALAH